MRFFNFVRLPFIAVFSDCKRQKGTSAGRQTFPLQQKLLFDSQLRIKNVELFHLYLCTGSFELFLNSLSILLGYLLLNSLGSAVYESLCFLQAETGDLANSLDDSNLVAANALQDNVKLSLLSLSSSSLNRTCNSNSSSSGYAKLVLYSVNQLRELENGEAF